VTEDGHLIHDNTTTIYTFLFGLRWRIFGGLWRFRFLHFLIPVFILFVLFVLVVILFIFVFFIVIIIIVIQIIPEDK